MMKFRNMKLLLLAFVLASSHAYAQSPYTGGFYNVFSADLIGSGVNDFTWYSEIEGYQGVLIGEELQWLTTVRYISGNGPSQQWHVHTEEQFLWGDFYDEWEYYLSSGFGEIQDENFTWNTESGELGGAGPAPGPVFIFPHTAAFQFKQSILEMVGHAVAFILLISTLCVVFWLFSFLRKRTREALYRAY